MHVLKILLKSVGEIRVGLSGENPRTIEGIWASLPFESTVSKWGDEIYFEIPVEMGEENSKVEVEVGDVAYWPDGRALCLFFGRTPSSVDEKPRAYGPVNVVGKIEGDPTILRKAKSGEKVRVEKA